MKNVILLFAIIGLASCGSSSDKNNQMDSADRAGYEIYSRKCQSCHLPEGQGISGTYPPLASSDFLSKTEEVIRTVKYGRSGAITVNGEKYSGVMPSPGLSDSDVVIVINYVRSHWGNDYEKITIDDVKKVMPE